MTQETGRPFRCRSLARRRLPSGSGRCLQEAPQAGTANAAIVPESCVLLGSCLPIHMSKFGAAACSSGIGRIAPKITRLAIRWVGFLAGAREWLHVLEVAVFNKWRRGPSAEQSESDPYRTGFPSRVAGWHCHALTALGIRAVFVAGPLERGMVVKARSRSAQGPRRVRSRGDRQNRGQPRSPRRP